jgi:apolipoprotein D and lipocalin family protein
MERVLALQQNPSRRLIFNYMIILIILSILKAHNMHKFLLACLTILLFGACATANSTDKNSLDAVPNIDVPRYMGKWYEIARLPNGFQTMCESTVSATYAQKPNGLLSVSNACKKSDGTITSVEGEARQARGSQQNSKLQVRFAPAWLSWLPMVWGDYWIIDLAPDYSYAVIGEPSRAYLWILSRTPTMDAALYEKIIVGAAGKGFDVTKVQKTTQIE